MKIRLLFSLLFVSLLSISANSKVDSLLNILDKESNDTLRLRVNVALSAEYIKTDLKQALEYNSNSLELAKKMNHPREIAAAYHRYAYIYSKLDQKEKATEYYLMSARILEKEGTDFDLAAINNSLGLLMMESDERQKALNYYNKALAYASNEKHSKIKAGILNNIGSVYLREKNDSLALSLFQSAVNLNVQNGNADWLANNYANIAKSA